MTADVIVIGAGPAGCAAATVLAECGYTVLVIDRPHGARRALAESIPPSARRILAELGMDAAVASEGFESWRGNTVWWADAPRLVQLGLGAADGELDVLAELLRHVAHDAVEAVEGLADLHHAELQRYHL